MLKKNSLLERVNKLEKKVNPEEVMINNFIVVMKEFSMSYEEVKALPLYAYHQMLKWIQKKDEEYEKKRKEREGKRGLGGLKSYAKR